MSMIFLFVCFFYINIMFFSKASPAKRDKSFQFCTKFEDELSEGVTHQSTTASSNASDVVTNISV